MFLKPLRNTPIQLANTCVIIDLKWASRRLLYGFEGGVSLCINGIVCGWVNSVWYRISPVFNRKKRNEFEVNVTE